MQLVQQRLPSCFSGLTNNGNIKCIYQDSRGFIWIASMLGLAQYDGYELKYFKHDKNNPQSIANSVAVTIKEDSKGNLWFGLISGGLSCYDPITNTFKNYSTKSIVSSSQDMVMALYLDAKDEVWFSIGLKGLSHLNKANGTFETWDVVTAERCPFTKPYKVPLHNFLMDITDKDENNLWLGTPEGLFSFNKTSKKITVMRPKFSKELHHDIYNAKSIIKDGRNIWIGGWGSGIQCYDTLAKSWIDYSSVKPGEKLALTNTINQIEPKDSDEFWVVSNDRGLGTFNINTHTFFFLSSLPDYDYMPKFGAYHMCIDRQKNLFVAFTDNFFFLKQTPILFNEYKVPSYSNLNLGLTLVNCLFEDKSKRFIYVSTSYSDGIIRYDRLTNTSKALSLTLNNKKVDVPYVAQFIERDSISMWMFTSESIYIYYYYDDKITLPPQPPLLNKIRGTNSYTTIAKQGEKYLWLGTNYNGIIRYEIETGNTLCFATDEKDTAQFLSNYVHSLIADNQGNLWYGNARSALLAYYNVRTGKSTCFDREGKSCNAKNSVATYSFYADGKDLYACTAAGLMIFDLSGSEPKLKRKIDEDNGFTSNFIAFVYKTNDSTLLMSTYYGVLSYNLYNKVYESVAVRNALYNNIYTFIISNKGNLFLTGYGPFNEYLPYVKSLKEKALAPVLTSFKVNDEDINYNLSIKDKGKIIIEPNYSYFTVSFASLVYANAASVKYSFMLEGFHKNWIDAGDRRYATLSNLNGGNYVLKIRASFDNGANYSDVTSIPIYIETLYYKTWWFRLGLALIFSMLLFGIYKYRTQQKLEIDELNNRAQLLEKEKSVVQYENLKQQLNPHFLFNSLTSLSSLITVDPKIARQFVDQMSKIYRYILKSSENETVPLINEITFATTYVKLQQTRFPKGFEVNFNINEEYNHRKIVPVTIQNMIENAIKHNIIDEEFPLVIDIFIEDDFLVVKNNLQRKGVVESSNKVGLEKMKTLYKYLINKLILINETSESFSIKIPLI
jgi:ligand-binding sensor domain-containing protein